MLQKEGTAVSIVSSRTPPSVLQELCAFADIVVSAVGSPGIVTEHVARPGAIVVNVGTTVDELSGRLLPDVAISSPEGQVITAAPGGVGPNPIMILFENVLSRAESRAAKARKAAATSAKFTRSVPSSAILDGWAEGLVGGQGGRPYLHKVFVADSFEVATGMLKDVAAITAELNHHPLVSLSPAASNKETPDCFNHGCRIEFKVQSIEAGRITEADIQLATRIDEELE